MKKKEKPLLIEYSRFLDSSQRHLTYSALSAYRNLAEQLSEKERRYLQRHLDSCAACSARLKEVEEVETGMTPLRISTSRWATGPVFRYAIAAVLVLALAVAVTFLSRNQQPTESAMRSQSQTLAANTPDPQRFIPNDILENFIERQTRSVLKGEFVNPRTGDTLSIPCTFSWKSTKGLHKYALVLVDNKNVEVLKELTSVTTVSVTKRLEQGLYYGKLEVDGDLVNVRRFVVSDKKR